MPLLKNVGRRHFTLMNKQDRYERGERLLDDARFVREVLMDAAARANKWNIVVFESYRAAELLIKGIIYSMGYEPRSHHRLHSLVAQLSGILEKDKHSLPFVYKAIDSRGNCYLLRIVGRTLKLLKLISGSYTQLGSTVLENAYLPPKLIKSGFTISVHQGPKELLITCDSSVASEITYERELLKAPDESRLEQLKQLVEILLSTREEAFYSERPFTQDDGEKAIHTLSTVCELSKAFEVNERI